MKNEEWAAHIQRLSYSSFFILHSSFFILHSSFFILHSSLINNHGMSQLPHRIHRQLLPILRTTSINKAVYGKKRSHVDTRSVGYGQSQPSTHSV